MDTKKIPLDDLPLEFSEAENDYWGTGALSDCLRRYRIALAYFQKNEASMNHVHRSLWRTRLIAMVRDIRHCKPASMTELETKAEVLLDPALETVGFEHRAEQILDDLNGLKSDQSSARWLM